MRDGGNAREEGTQRVSIILQRRSCACEIKREKNPVEHHQALGLQSPRVVNGSSAERFNTSCKARRLAMNESVCMRSDRWQVDDIGDYNPKT